MNCLLCFLPITPHSGAGRPRKYHRACIPIRPRRNLPVTRAQVVEMLGSKCIHCGTVEALDLSHDNRDGSQDRGQLGRYDFYRAVLNGERIDISLRCRRCHLLYDLGRTETHCGAGHSWEDNLYTSPSGVKYCMACKRKKWQDWKKANRPKVNAYYRART